MLRHPDYTRARLRQLSERLFALVYSDRRSVEDLKVSPRVARISRQEAERLDYRPVSRGAQFGPLFATYWFKGNAKVPSEWEGKRVDLLWNSHSEATLWVDGKTMQGLNYEAGSNNSVRVDACLLERARGGEAVSFEIEMACNRVLGERTSRALVFPHPYSSLSSFVLDQCDLACFDAEAWQLYVDFYVLLELEAQQLGDLDKTWGGELLSELNRFANVCVPEDRFTWRAAREILGRLYTRKNGTTVHEITAIGHAHLDLAWLWPVGEAVRKAERTFSSQLAYMDRYPEFKFACSQAQQLAWMKERNPELFERLRAKVSSGQLIPVGGTWVEPDCNLPSGESLVRQFLYGQRFFERELGVTCKEFWNPDVFGYNGQLPQIMRGAGAGRFVTQKLSWNRFNTPHHHSFTWQGIDGTEVLTHFPPTDAYDSFNARVTVAQLRDNARGFKDHDRSGRSMMTFGYGDGGGGPTPLMLEVLRRVEDLEGIPRTRIGTPDEFFEKLEREFRDRPTVVGELYFEYHRGTYTTQAATKRGNRKSEQLLHELELFATAAHVLAGTPYPQAELEQLWKRLLLNQFHDILPGSSIGEVYEDAARDYQEIAERGGALRARALEALVPTGAGRTPINSIGVARREVVETPEGQRVFVEAPSYGIGKETSSTDRVQVTQSATSTILENHHLRAELSADGSVASLLDKATGRQVLAGPGNQLLLYDDHPTAWDAWDVDPFHLETERPCVPASGGKVIVEGPLRGAVAFERAIGTSSHARQVVRLDAESRRLEFHTEVDWHESHTMLKVAFSVNVRAMNATYEMQFGAVERPTHYNTLYDLARYEVPGHRWADLSEHGFGVALLSESKYGFSTFGNVMRLSLLRAPTWPDPRADRGHHAFAYAILPHAGDWRAGGVVGEALCFNVPITWARGQAQPRAWAEIEGAGLLLDTIKRAEDSEALVLRLYEAHGGRGVAKVRVAFPFEEAFFCNLLERKGERAQVEQGVITIPFRPYEIISLLLQR